MTESGDHSSAFVQDKLRVFALEVFLKAYYKQAAVVVLENGEN